MNPKHPPPVHDVPRLPRKGGVKNILIQANRKWISVIPNLKQKAKEIALASGATNVTIRFAEDDEVQKLNHQFRGYNKSTNVLSFPDDEGEGDIILARGIIFAEAKEQKKDPLHHTLHLVAHGVLHLLGYDHMNSKDAHKMESLEIKILEQFGIGNPYE